MYLFLMFGLPIGFLLLAIDSYPEQERDVARRAFLKGLATFIPLWIIARILGYLVPADEGSILLAFHEWADRLLPYSALPALGYLVFYRPGERLGPGEANRRLTAFYAGALSPVGICETFRLWGSPSFYGLFLLPILLAAICLAMPKLAARVYMSYGSGLAASIALVAVLGLVASACPRLFLLHLWPVAIVVAGGIGAGAWFYARDDLAVHAPGSTVG